MDVSASMGSANRLNFARSYLKDSFRLLDHGRDRFNIIAFSRDTYIFHRSKLLLATKENLDSGMHFLDEYTPQSIRMNTKTDLLSALIRAMEMEPNMIVLVTDGLPTAG